MRVVRPRHPIRNVRRKRKILMYRDGGRCHWCHRVLVMNKDGSVAHPVEGDRRPWATLDHLVPVIDGGGGSVDNLVLACVRCNQARGLARWLELKEDAA